MPPLEREYCHKTYTFYLLNRFTNCYLERERTTIQTSLQPGTIAVVKIGEKAIKVAIK